MRNAFGFGVWAGLVLLGVLLAALPGVFLVFLGFVAAGVIFRRRDRDRRYAAKVEHYRREAERRDG